MVNQNGALCPTEPLRQRYEKGGLFLVAARLLYPRTRVSAATDAPRCAQGIHLLHPWDLISYTHENSLPAPTEVHLPHSRELVSCFHGSSLPAPTGARFLLPRELTSYPRRDSLPASTRTCLLCPRARTCRIRICPFRPLPRARLLYPSKLAPCPHVLRLTFHATLGVVTLHALSPCPYSEYKFRPELKPLYLPVSPLS